MATREIMRYGIAITPTRALNFIDDITVIMTNTTLARNTANIIRNTNVTNGSIMIPIIGINTVLTVWGMIVTSRVMTATTIDMIADNNVEQVAKM